MKSGKRNNIDTLNYYATLGVAYNSSNEVIKNTYRKLAKKLHPDVNNGDEFYSEKFKQIDEAYRELIDPEKRRRHDIYLGLYNDPIKIVDVESESPKKEGPPQKSKYETRQAQSSSLFTSIGNIYRYIGSVKLNYWLLLLIAIGSFTIADLNSGGQVTKYMITNFYEKNSKLLIAEDEVRSDNVGDIKTSSKSADCHGCQNQAVQTDINSLEGVYDVGVTKKIETQIGIVYIIVSGKDKLNVFGYFNRGSPSYNLGQMFFGIRTASQKVELGKVYELIFEGDKFNIKLHSTFITIERLTYNNSLFGYGVRADGLFTKTHEELPDTLQIYGEFVNSRDAIPAFYIDAN